MGYNPLHSQTGEKTYKLVAALKGAQTLFGNIQDRAKYQELMDAEQQNNRTNADGSPVYEAEAARIRTELTKVIQPANPLTSGQATIYRVGDEYAVIHSEPPVREPRIFVSVLPGSKAQIEEFRVNNESRS